MVMVLENTERNILKKIREIDTLKYVFCFKEYCSSSFSEAKIQAITEHKESINKNPIRVPADNVDLVGVRDVVDSAGLDRVFNVLRQPYTEEPTNWSRRYKANLEKLASGDVIKVAEVVRDLYRRDLDRGLSAGEKRMLAKAKQILVSELALAERTDEDKAATMLDEVLAS